jgi:hypothetical protein
MGGGQDDILWALALAERAGVPTLRSRVQGTADQTSRGDS